MALTLVAAGVLVGPPAPALAALPAECGRSSAPTPTEAAAFDLGPIAQSDTLKKATPPRPSTPPDTLTRPDQPVTPGRAELPAGGVPRDTSGARSRIVTLPRAEGAPARVKTPLSDPRLRPTFEQPRWVMMRSLVVPGWGQLHNRAWLKALAIAGGEGALIYGIVDDERKLTDLQRRVDAARAANQVDEYTAAVAAYNSRLDQATARKWWLGGLIAYALIDAYIDAHFIDFEVQFEEDRALPEGAPPAPAAKLRVGWSF